MAINSVQHRYLCNNKNSYPHDGSADKNPYRHDSRGDKNSYRHDRRADSLSLTLHSNFVIFLFESYYLFTGILSKIYKK